MSFLLGERAGSITHPPLLIIFVVQLDLGEMVPAAARQ
jgi:hypothetical protein